MGSYVSLFVTCLNVNGLSIRNCFTVLWPIFVEQLEHGKSSYEVPISRRKEEKEGKASQEKESMRLGTFSYFGLYIVNWIRGIFSKEIHHASAESAWRMSHVTCRLSCTPESMATDI